MNLLSSGSARSGLHIFSFFGPMVKLDGLAVILGATETRREPNTVGRFRKPTHNCRRSSINTNDKVHVLGIKFAVPGSSLTQDLHNSSQAETYLFFKKKWLLRKAMI